MGNSCQIQGGYVCENGMVKSQTKTNTAQNSQPGQDLTSYDPVDQYGQSSDYMSYYDPNYQDTVQIMPQSCYCPEDPQQNQNNEMSDDGESGLVEVEEFSDDESVGIGKNGKEFDVSTKRIDPGVRKQWTNRVSKCKTQYNLAFGEKAAFAVLDEVNDGLREIGFKLNDGTILTGYDSKYYSPIYYQKVEGKEILSVSSDGGKSNYYLIADYDERGLPLLKQCDGQGNVLNNTIIKYDQIGYIGYDDGVSLSSVNITKRPLLKTDQVVLVFTPDTDRNEWTVPGGGQAFGVKVEMTTSQGVKNRTMVAFNASGQMMAIVGKDANGRTIVKTETKYDESGNITDEEYAVIISDDGHGNIMVVACNKNGEEVFGAPRKKLSEIAYDSQGKKWADRYTIKMIELKPLMISSGSVYVLVKPQKSDWYMREEIVDVKAGPAVDSNFLLFFAEGDVAVPTPAGVYSTSEPETGFKTNRWADSVIPQGSKFVWEDSNADKQIEADEVFYVDPQTGEKINVVESFKEFALSSIISLDNPPEFLNISKESWLKMDKSQRKSFCMRQNSFNSFVEQSAQLNTGAIVQGYMLDNDGQPLDNFKNYDNNPFGKYVVRLYKNGKQQVYRLHDIPMNPLEDTGSHGCVHFYQLQNENVRAYFESSHNPKFVVMRYNRGQNLQIDQQVEVFDQAANNFN